MNITIDLPLLQLEDVIYDDDTLRYEKMRMEMWHDNNLKTLSDIISTSQDIFFQSEMTINKGLLEQSDLDPDNVSFGLAKFLFKDIQRAEVVRQHFDTIKRYDEIEPEIYDATKTYVVNDITYEVYSYNELMSYARQSTSDRLYDMSISEIIGEVEFIKDYFDVINVKRVAKDIRKKIKEDSLNSSMSDDFFNNDEEIIMWMSEHDEEYLFDVIQSHMDYEKLGNQTVDSEEEAIVELENIGQTLTFAGDVTFIDNASSYFYVFERY